MLCTALVDECGINAALECQRRWNNAALVVSSPGMLDIPEVFCDKMSDVITMRAPLSHLSLSVPTVAIVLDAPRRNNAAPHHAG